jgi:hypothetical protein
VRVTMIVGYTNKDQLVFALELRSGRLGDNR